MKLHFSGDRSSKMIKVGKFFRKIFGKKIIAVDLWDGYSSQLFWRK